MRSEVNLRSFDDSSDLGPIQGQSEVQRAASRPGFNLDEGQDSRKLGNDVDFSPARPKVALQNRPAFLREKGYRLALALAALFAS